jgi:protease-4
VRGKKRWIVLALVVIVVIAVLIARREPTISPGSYLVVEIGGTYSESRPPGLIGQLLGAQTKVLTDVLMELRKAAVDPRLRGVVVKLTPVDMALAQVQELRHALQAVREQGKRVLVWVSGEGASGNREYYLASVADKVYFSENAVLPLVGLRATYMFLGGLWENLKIDMQVEKIREYKTMGDFLARKTMSEAHRTMANALLDSLYEQLVDDIAEARSLAPERVRALIDAPTLSAHDFLQAGLIDGIVYYDDLVDTLEKQGAQPVEMVPLSTYRQVKPTSVGLMSGPTIAVIYGVGAVVTGESDWGSTGPTMGSKTIVEAFDQAAEDEAVRAIVFRIDSPGGSALASDLIWHAVERARQKKPVVVSMSGVAASGGYYIAAGATRIVAHPATLTGSIGIVFALPDVQGFLNRLGVNTETLTRGRYASLFSPTQSWSPEEREQIVRLLEGLYDTFVRKVAEGRKLSIDDVKAVARGRVWTGAQAKERGLVDELGGLDTALRLAKREAGIPAESSPRLVFYPKAKGLLEALLERLGGQVRMPLALPRSVRQFAETLAPYTRAGNGPLFAMPVRVEIR